MIIIQKICACYLKPHKSKLKQIVDLDKSLLRDYNVNVGLHSRYTIYNNNAFISQV